MRYPLELRPSAARELRKLDRDTADRILEALDLLADGLGGDVKRLTDSSAEYRLRVGPYRVLFDIERDRILIRRVRHRRDAYRR